MKIGELSRRTGATQRALRYYEERGLLRPERRESGYRDYDERAVRDVRRIQVLLSAGINSALVAEILPNVADEHDFVLPGRCPEIHAGLTRERQRLNASIDDLLTARDVLDSLIGRPL